MSTIGKIFVVVNLVLSLVVVGAAGALLNTTETTQADFQAEKARADGLQAELDQAGSDYQARERVLNSDKQQLQEDNDDLEVEKTNLQRANDKLELDNQQLRDDVTKINARLDSLEGDLQTTTQRNRELETQNADLRTQAADAKEAQRLAEVGRRDAEDGLNQIRLDMTAMQDELDRLQSELRDKGAMLEVAISSGFDPTAVVSAPPIEANVVEVDAQYGFVILDKGGAHDVRRGYTFEIHRGGQYLGRVRVSEVYDGYSTAMIDFQSPGTQMQRFDRASTHLSY